MTFFTNLLERISGLWDNFSSAVTTFTGSLAEYTSKPAILPQLWTVLPTDITNFFLACLVVGLFVIVLKHFIGRSY